MTKADSGRLALLVSEVNPVKSRLMALANEIGAISPAKAKSLDKLIGRLESWQGAFRKSN